MYAERPAPPPLIMSWRVERSRGGTGDWWVHYEARRGGRQVGCGSMSLPRPEKITRRELAATIWYISSSYGIENTEAQRYFQSTCEHNWWELEDGRLCVKCNLEQLNWAKCPEIILEDQYRP